MALTSNSSQNPCLTLSVASASLLSSRTRLSISAALMRVVFRGCRKHNTALSGIRNVKYTSTAQKLEVDLLLLQ